MFEKNPIDSSGGRRRASTSPAPWIAALALVLAAPTTAIGQTSYTHRLTTIVYDYDVNGVPDATRSFSYDPIGRVVGQTYSYFGDGTTDVFVTQDDEALSESTVVTWATSTQVDTMATARVRMDLGLDEFLVDHTYDAGRLSHVDSSVTLGDVTSETYTDLTYVNGLLSTFEERDAGDDSLIYTQIYAHGGNGLPSLAILVSPGIEAQTTFSWRGDGRLDALSSAATSSGTPIGAGTADYVYDAAGRIGSEVWTFSGFVGSFFAQFQGTAYTKTYAYDDTGLKLSETIDVGSNGAPEATQTYVWAEAACVPLIIFASNGRPNFAAEPGLPWVPGTGATSVENCPEPGFAVGLGSTLVGLAISARRRRGTRRPRLSNARGTS